ncbi:hypothetical protein F4556_003528 [Kitasatospora gansuensis]|uniref:Uncharacterized protein n=1 Tax=Kitasatospora gansuensis TaxID=258050 RepID=A0A7W7SDN6_9ACTN|nr:hypothetical protein [Kitasatospora gansuensis]MBB4947993.1 hypothetical protein [Kitasatospora gansuensis]
MEHQMRAEYGPDGQSGGVKSWHITVGDTITAMCGHELVAGGETREPTRWSEQPDLNCHTCGALFLREVPYLPSEHIYREQP